MSQEQQEQALAYFREHAGEWMAKAVATGERTVNVIRQRNDFVLDVIRRRAATAALDVGCGTGDLACDIARLGVEATGVDFADEMVTLARARAAEQRLSNVRFECASIFDFAPARQYDVISANGLIEYISPDELGRLFDLAHDLLTPGGSLVLGSRNRLFNVMALNAFTLWEIEGGHATTLLREAVALASGATLAELEALEAAPLQPPGTEHERTGIEVATRYQYTPVQLIQLAGRHGFTTQEVSPVHIHGVPTAFKDVNPDIHAGISNLLQSVVEGRRALVPYASSFMLHARRGGPVTA